LLQDYFKPTFHTQFIYQSAKISTHSAQKNIPAGPRKGINRLRIISV